MACKKALVRQIPGRIIGRTNDLDNKEGFVLTLQAREQHIRRSKATSNICTNQGLMVTAATIHMALLGPEGLRRVAAQSYANAQKLVSGMEQLSGVKKVFNGPIFHEATLSLPKQASDVLQTMKAQRILGGLDLQAHYPEIGNAILVCATETKTSGDLLNYTEQLKNALS